MSVEDRLYDLSADGFVSLGYDRNVHTGRREWVASINVIRPARGVRMTDRLRRGYGSNPTSAMLDLERRLEQQ